MKVSPVKYAQKLRKNIKISGSTAIARRLCKMILESHENMAKPTDEIGDFNYTFPEMVKILALLLESNQP